MVSWTSLQGQYSRSTRNIYSAGGGLLALSSIASYLLLCALPAVLSQLESSPPEQSLQVRVCVFQPIYELASNGTPTGAPYAAGLGWTTATALAFHHVNTRNCSLLGPSCQPLLDAISPPEGPWLVLDPQFVDTHLQYSKAVAATATTDCQAEGTEFIIGSTTSSQSSIISFLANSIGQLHISATASSPTLSDEETYPAFARTSATTTAVIQGASVFANRMGWTQVACLHVSDLWGDSTCKAYVESMQNQGISCTTIPLGDFESERSIRHTILELQQTGIKVSIVVIFQTSLPLFAEMANDILGEEYDSHVWILGDMSISTGMASISEPSVRQLMEGFLSASAQLNIIDYEPLSDGVREFAETFRQQVASGLDSYLRSGLDPSLGYPGSLNLEADRQALLDVISSISDTDELDHFSTQNYDTVWALAAGLGAALKNHGGETSDLAAKVIEAIASGTVPAFDGLSSFRSWAPNGDSDATGMHTIIHSYAQYGEADNGGNSTASAVEVARWNVNTGLILSEGHPVMWRDGSQYPQVPGDGSQSEIHPWLIPSAIAIAVVTVVLVLVLVYVLYRTKHLEGRLDVLLGMGHRIDLDSPVMKILDFLELCKDAPLWKQPSRKDASKLHDLILMNAGRLTEPTLDSNTGSWLNGQLRWFMTAQPGYSRPGVPQDETFEADSLAASRQASQSNLSIPGRLNPMHPSTASMSSNPPLPGDLNDTIGHEFFVDAVTESSNLRQCASPLAAVARVTWEKHLRRCYSRLRCDVAGAASRLSAYAARIEMGYADDLYHCKLHAADVTSRMMAIMVNSGLHDVLLRRRIPLGLVTLTASAMHDYNHPQRNNQLLITKGHSTAEEFNDQAPAENHSLREALRLLSEPQFNFLESLGIAQQRDDVQLFRSVLIQIVLGTEMARHFDLLGQFDAQVANNQHLRGLRGHQMWAAMNETQRTLTLQIAMKVADIGHCAAPLAQHKLWCERLEEEFFAQGDEERQLGLHVSAMMDRRKPGAQDPSSQVGFFRIIAIPLFTAWVNAFPDCEPILQQANRNMEYWASISGDSALKPKQTV